MFILYLYIIIFFWKETLHIHAYTFIDFTYNMHIDISIEAVASTFLKLHSFSNQQIMKRVAFSPTLFSLNSF